MSSQSIKQKLTKVVVDNAQPKEKRYHINDTEIPSFRLAVQPSGAKSYVLDYRMAKGRNVKKQRVTIGSAKKLPLAHAREHAKKWLIKIAAGIDPRAVEIKQGNKHLFEHVWKRYINEYVAIENEKSTLVSVVKRGNARILPYFKGMYVEDITREQINDFLMWMKNVPTQANRCKSALSRLFNLAETRWGYRDRNSNPCQDSVRYKEQSRDRYLEVSELQRLLKVLTNIIQEGVKDYHENAHKRALYRVRQASYFQLLLHTGARGIEWRTLEISRIDLERSIIKPKTKNKEPAIAIPPKAIEIINFLLGLPRDDVNNPYLFPGVYAPCMSYPKAIWAEIKLKAKLEDFVPHDTRHSWAAFALAGGYSLADVGQQLNHRSYQTTKRYEHLAHEIKQKNVAGVSDIILTLGENEGKIVDIRSNSKAA